MEERVSRLERENRRLKRAGIVALAVIASVVLMGQATEGATTDLLKAAAAGHTATVQALVAAGADVHAKGPKGWTALMFAAFKGHTVIVQALVAAGADVHAKGPKGWTALRSAAIKGHTAIVQLLKQAGARE